MVRLLCTAMIVMVAGVSLGNERPNILLVMADDLGGSLGENPGTGQAIFR